MLVEKNATSSGIGTYLYHIYIARLPFNSMAAIEGSLCKSGMYEFSSSNIASIH